MRYSPEKIFSGLIPALDINFVDPQDWGSNELNERSIARALHETIASWYVSLRNLALVALMLVLVYIGIRIVISSTASDKAKFKQMLMDWVVAMCLLFCLHYIMTFTTTIVNEISRAISGSASSNGNNVAVQVTGDDIPVEFNTDLMGLIRFKMQSPNVTGKILYLILYLAMVIYTFMFTFYYLKRVLTIAFLTLISPLVALTYPIDKIRDGKAQAFDMWLKEYTFNALLQPFHLIIYSIFVGSAIDLAAKNPLFAIVALAFITPAEKILRKFFGFEKASTAGALGAVASAAGGAAFMNQMQKLMSPKKGGGAAGNKGIKTKDRSEGSAPSLGDAFGNGNGGGENPPENNPSGNNPPEGPSAQERMLDAYDEGWGTDAYDPAEREAMARDTYQQPEPRNYTDEEYRQSLRDVGYTDEDINELIGSAPVAGEDNGGGSGDISNSNPPPSNSPPSDPPSPPELPDPPPTPDRLHGQGVFQWSDNDDRTAGQYLGGIARAGASWAGNKIANSTPGQEAIRLGRNVAGKAKSVRDMAADKAQKVGDWASGKAQQVGDWGRENIPKPIRNSAGTLARATGNAAVSAAKATGRAALGVGNVAVQSGLAVGKAALKAAPGAIIGTAAGIAGDELSDIPKYALGGAALTSTIGTSAVAQAGSFIADAYRQGSGTSYEASIEQRKKDYIDNNKELYQQKFPEASRKELKEKLEQGAYYDSVGIEGKDTLKAVSMQKRIKEEMMAQQQGMAEEDANRRAQAQTAAIMKEVKDYSAKDLVDEKKVESLRNNLSRRLEGQGLTGREKTQTVDMIVREMKKARGVE